MGEKITVIDYGINNLLSICRALEYCGASVTVATNGKEIKEAGRLVLPGVGAFPDGMNELNSRGLTEAIQDFYTKGNPLFGICLGMQLLLETGFEIKETAGIGIVKGSVRRLPEEAKMKVPHVNWNRLKKGDNTDWNSSILSDITDADYMYFVHSFYTDLANPNEVLAQTEFGNFNFTSAIKKDNCWATQFHPEKSGERGLKILKSFLKI